MNCAASLGSVLVLLTSSALADDLGRLFFTPAERAQFDADRRAALVPEADKPPTPAPEIALHETKPLPTVTMNGVVLRRNGPSSLWLNGEYQDAHTATLPGSEDHPVHLESGSVVVTPNPAAPALRIKPGQTYDPTRAKVVDAYETALPAAPAH